MLNVCRIAISPPSRHSYLFQILRRHRIDQPDAVCRAEECEAGPVHGGRGDAKYNRPAMTPADGHGGGYVARQMHVMPRHLTQAGAQDRLDIAVTRAVKQLVGRLELFELEVHVDAVSLVGADPRAVLVERETLLVAAGHDNVKIRARNGDAVLLTGGEQVRHGD